MTSHVPGTDPYNGPRGKAELCANLSGKKKKNGFTCYKKQKPLIDST